MSDHRLPSEVSSAVARRGARWVVAARLATRAVSLVQYAVVARLIGPSELGRAGAVLLVVTGLESVTQAGLETALLRERVLTSRAVSTVWVTQAVRGALLAGLVVAVAGPVSRFLDVADMTDTLRLVAIALVLRGARNPWVVRLQRDLDFRSVARLDVGPAVLGAVVAVALALDTASAAAVIAGVLAQDVARLLQSWRVPDVRPGLDFSSVDLRSLLGFGRWVFASRVLVFVITQADDIAVAAALGPQALGTYQLAYLVSNAGAVEVASVVNSIAYPIYARVRDEAERLGRAYDRIVGGTALLALPVSIGIALVADPFAAVVLGDAWDATVPVIRVLGVWGAVRALGAATSPLLQAVGRPAVITGFQAVMALAMAVTILPAMDRFGVTGAALAVTVPNLLLHGLRYRFIARATGLPTRRLVRPLVVPLVSTAVMVVAVLALRTVDLESAAADLAVGVAVGAITYTAAAVLLDSRLQDGTLRDTVIGLARGGGPR